MFPERCLPKLQMGPPERERHSKLNYDTLGKIQSGKIPFLLVLLFPTLLHI
jgi:hypothetical protein